VWDSTNTGSTGPYTNVTNGVHATVAGTTYSGLHVTGVISSGDGPRTVEVSANNVTFRNCLFDGDMWYYPFWIDSGITGTRFIDCTVNGINGNQTEGLRIQDGLMLRCNISHFENPIWMTGCFNAEVANNYVHDINSDPPRHSDGVEMNSGGNVTYHYNCIDVLANTSQLEINNYNGPINDVIVDANILTGTSAYSVYFDNEQQAPPANPITNCQLTRNRISGWTFGPWATYSSDVFISGNVNHLTGAPLP
jgi:hypothetical protein